jgi:hypothetical protein
MTRRYTPSARGRAGRLLLSAAVFGAALTVVPAGAQDTCQVPEYLTHVDGKLPHVAAAAARKRLDILVVGTGSSALGGQSGGQTAYPARLEAALKGAFPDLQITLKVVARPRWPTAEMAHELSSLTGGQQKPDLVIWQTGTVDAIRGVDPDGFRYSLEKGVNKLLTAGIDVALINMQYSPRTESMITAGPYGDAMRWVAQQHDVPLFDRLAVMKYWSESGVFDLIGPDRTQVAERVHDCLGRLLAEVIIDTAGLRRPTAKDSR